eukprot:491957_1
MAIAWASHHGDIVLVDSRDTEGSSSTSQAGLKRFKLLLQKMKIAPETMSYVHTFDPFSSVDGKERQTNLTDMFEYTSFAKLLHEGDIFRSGKDLVQYYNEDSSIDSKSVWNNP